MRGTIVAYAAAAGWGFVEGEIEGEVAGGQKSKHFFHVRNSPTYQPVLGQLVEFELAPPFRLGQPDQAVNLRAVHQLDAAQLLYAAVKS
jgi:hypothetical protein